MDNNFNFYDKEIEFYGEIALKFNEKMNEFSEFQIVPECFGVDKIKKIMVMEDLRLKGYNVIQDRNGYNIAQAKAILKRMAAFHSIGAILHEENPNVFTSKHFKNGWFI